MARMTELRPIATGRVSGRLGLVSFTAVLFFTVVGGPYGIEPVVQSAGPLLAIVLILVTPLIWSVPTALMVAELSAAIPVPGGYYAWVKRALGSFWGFQEAWWSWLVSFVDMGIYPVLFGTYGSAVLRDLTGVDWFVSDAGRWILATVLIWTVVGANLFGARVAGWLAAVSGVLVVAPFVAMTWMAVEGLSSFGTVIAAWSGGPPSGQGTASALGAGLFVVMWNYQGWAGVATVNGEVRRPGTTIPIALGIVVVLSVLTYLVPVLAALTVTSDPAAWGDGALPALAGAIGGEGLRFAVGVGAVIGVAGLFNANLLANSRIPMALGEDHYLPPVLAKANARTGAPTASLILCGVMFTFIALVDFTSLAVIDVVVYSATLLLEFLALLVLRIREPRIIRPFRVPGGLSGIALITALPTVLLGLAIANELADGGVMVLALSGAVLATGPVAWVGLTIVFKRGRPNRPVPVDLEGMVRHGAYDPVMAWTPRIMSPFRVGTTIAERAGAWAPIHQRQWHDGSGR